MPVHIAGIFMPFFVPSIPAYSRYNIFNLRRKHNYTHHNHYLLRTFSTLSSAAVSMTCQPYPPGRFRLPACFDT